MTLPFVVFLVAAAIALRLVWYVVARVQHAQNARKLGCGPVPAYPRDLFGISTLKESLAADKVKAIPELAERRVKYMSDQEGRYVSTFRMRMLNREHVVTVDPKNIQAVLATQFKDFELGQSRRNALHPLLGTGIVSSAFVGDRYVANDSTSSLPTAMNGPDLELCFARNSPVNRSAI